MLSGDVERTNVAGRAALTSDDSRKRPLLVTVDDGATARTGRVHRRRRLEVPCRFSESGKHELHVYESAHEQGPTQV